MGYLYLISYFTHYSSCKQKSQSETCLLLIKVAIMIFIIFLIELFGFLLHPLWLFCFLVIWVTVISQEFIQAYKTILVTINIFSEKNTLHIGYWPSVRSRWLDFGQVLFLRVYKLAKKEQGQYPAILTEQTWSIKDLLYGFRKNFSCRIQRVVLSRQDGSILPAQVTNQSMPFGSSCLLMELAIQ